MTEAATTVVFSVLGRTLVANGVDEDVATWLRHHWERPQHRVAESPYRITLEHLRASSLPATLRSRLPERRQPTPGDAQVVHTTADDRRAAVLLGSKAGGVHLELDPHGAHIGAWGVTGPQALGRWALLLALHEAVRASGLLPLHCSAAIRPGDGGATVFMGPSGVGKSTTLIRLARAGWSPVCEDVAWLDPESRALFAWDDGIRLREDGFAHPAQFAGSARLRTDPPKHLVTYGHLADHYGVQRQTSAPLQRLAHLVRGTGPSRWGRLSRSSAVPPLWEAIGLPLTRPAQRQVARQIAALVDTVSRCTLFLGDAPSSDRTLP